MTTTQTKMNVINIGAILQSIITLSTILYTHMYTHELCYKVGNVVSSVSKQVTLPTPMAPRFGHSGVVFGVGADFRVLVLVGGLADTTLLLLGKKWHPVCHTHNMAIF